MCTETNQILGRVHVRLWRGAVLLRDDWYHNLVTDVGDGYYAAMAIAGVSPAAAAAPTRVTGMKLGTGNTAVAKNGTGSTLAAYLSSSDQAFDSTYPQATNLGAGLGVEAVYQVTYQPGVATSTDIYEAVIVTDATTNATSTTANTVSRIVFSTPYPKGAGDTLALVWSHKFLGQ